MFGQPGLMGVILCGFVVKGSGVATKIDERMLLVGAIMVVIISVAATFMFWSYRYGGFGFGIGEGGEVVRNVTFSDAVITCQDEARAKLGTDLISISVDDHSSRYEYKSNLYKLFYNALVQNGRSETGRINLAVYCFVRADHGRVTHFEQVEQKENGEASPRKSGNGLFGWPM